MERSGQLIAQNPRVAAENKAARQRRRAYNKAVRTLEAKQAGTAQTFARTRVTESPIERLKSRGALNYNEIMAADEIVHAYRTMIGLPGQRDPDLGIPPSELRADAADDMSARRVDMLDTYRRWRRDLASIPALAVVMAAVIDETPVWRVAQARHVRYETALDQLRTGLRHFAALRGNTPRGARGWKYEAKRPKRAQ